MEKKNDGTSSINSNAKKFLLQRTMSRLYEIDQTLSDVSDDVRTALGEDSDLFSWVESLRGDTLDTIDIVDYEIGNSSAVNEGSGPSNGESSWFDDNGQLVKPIPGACVVDCGGSGRKDDKVDYWMRALGFDIGLPVAKAVQFLKEFGAWDDLDLLAEVASTGDIRKMRRWIADNDSNMDEREHFDAAQMAKWVLAHRILWEFCNEIRDQAYETSEEDLESVGLPGDINDWDDEDWVKFQTELSNVSL